jgi:hypothetical protein
MKNGRQTARRPVVLVQDFVVVAAPAAVSFELIQRGGNELFGAAATEARPFVFGPARHRHRGWAIPLCWREGSNSGLPGFDGDLVIAEVGSDSCWLGLEGSVVPRVDGESPASMDEATRSHRVALRSLLHGVARELESRTGARNASSS